MENSIKISVSNLNNVPETMLIPLCLKAKETREHGIITDNKALEIVRKIDYNFSKIEKDWRLQVNIATRTHLLDQIVIDLSRKSGMLVIVNLGAGLDTRHERFPNLKWYQLDLPESLAIRRQFFNDERATFIPKSVLDFSWINDIQERENVLFIAEGLLLYFTEDEVKSIFDHIGKSFTNSYFAFNTIHKFFVKKNNATVILRAPVRWGIQSVKSIEDWKLGWKQVQTYYLLDYHRSRWRGLYWLSLVLPGLKKGFAVALMKTGK